MIKKIFIVLTLILICGACGSSQRNCDAYGDNSEQKLNEDVQQNS